MQTVLFLISSFTWARSFQRQNKKSVLCHQMVDFLTIDIHDRRKRSMFNDIYKKIMISLHSNTSSSSTSQKIALNPVIRIFIVVCWSVRRFPHAGFEQWYIFSSWLDLFLDFDFPWVKLETGWSKMTGQTNLHCEWPLRLTDLDCRHSWSLSSIYEFLFLRREKIRHSLKKWGKNLDTDALFASTSFKLYWVSWFSSCIVAFIHSCVSFSETREN